MTMWAVRECAAVEATGHHAWQIANSEGLCFNIGEGVYADMKMVLVCSECGVEGLGRTYAELEIKKVWEEKK